MLSRSGKQAEMSGAPLARSGHHIFGQIFPILDRERAFVRARETISAAIF
jgi:hypothetical protein